LAGCPGLSALPSPPTVRGPLDTNSDTITDWLSFHTDTIAGCRYFFGGHENFVLWHRLTCALLMQFYILCTFLAGPLPWTGSLAGALPWVGILAGSIPWVAIASSVGSPLLNTRQSVVGDSVTEKLVQIVGFLTEAQLPPFTNIFITTYPTMYKKCVTYTTLEASFS